MEENAKVELTYKWKKRGKVEFTSQVYTRGENTVYLTQVFPGPSTDKLTKNTSPLSCMSSVNIDKVECTGKVNTRGKNTVYIRAGVPRYAT